MAKHGPGKNPKTAVLKQNRKKAQKPPVQVGPVEDESKRRTCMGCGVRYLITSDNYYCPNCAIENHKLTGMGWLDMQSVPWATELVKDDVGEGYTITKSGVDA